MNIAEQRRAVVREAATWIGTPFRHEARVKGAGVDCVYMPAESYNAAIGYSISPPVYSPQWHLHADKDGKFRELYLEGLVAQGFLEISDGKQIEPFSAEHFIAALKEPGDFVVVKLAKTYAHGAIILDWPWIIQTEAAPMGRGKVVKANAHANWYFTSRPLKFFSPKVWHP